MLSFVSFLVVIASSAVLFAAIRVAAFLQIRDRLLVAAIVVVAYALVVHLELRVWLLSNASVLALAVVVGTLIGSTLKSKGAIIAFCVAAATVDTLSFSGGLTHVILESFRSGNSSILIYLSIAVPIDGSLRPIVGIGDLVILAALFTGFSQVKCVGWLPFAVSVGGLLVALGVGLAVGGAPALPFVAFATVTYILSHSRTPRRAS